MTSHLRNTRHALAAVTVVAVSGLTVLVPPAAAAPSTGPVIAEVYGGGGNSGAHLTQDFIELVTVGSTAADLTGMSVQYLPASPTANSRWQATALSGSVEPGARYLVGEAKGGGGTAELPTPEATGSINMAAASGTVALVEGTTPLTCLTADDCEADSRIVDLVGYGSAVVRETGPAPAGGNTTSVHRPGLVDTDDNSADFAAGPPTPENSKGESPGEPGGGVTDTRIHDVQGITRTSPMTGKVVRSPRHRDRDADVRLGAWFLAARPRTGQRPAHQRGHLRRHRFGDPGRRGRRRRHRNRCGG